MTAVKQTADRSLKYYKQQSPAPVFAGAFLLRNCDYYIDIIPKNFYDKYINNSREEEGAIWKNIALTALRVQ